MSVETPEHTQSAIAFDIPVTATPQESASLLSEYIAQGYYAAFAVPWQAGSIRIFMRQQAKPKDKSPWVEPKQLTWEAQTLATKSKDVSPLAKPYKAEAEAFIRANKSKSVLELTSKLRELGMAYSDQAVKQMRARAIHGL